MKSREQPKKNENIVKQPVRETKVDQEKAAGKKKQLIRDVNTVGEYYKAWDKYDVDKQLEKLQ